MDFVSSLLTIFLLVLVVVLVIAPFESLKWWAGWVTDEPERASESKAPMKTRPALPPAEVQPDQYVLFLPGVGAMGTDVDSWEQSLVDLLQQGLDSGVVDTLGPLVVGGGQVLFAHDVILTRFGKTRAETVRPATVGLRA